jgi:predicted nucleotide-binding protein (sugar kinase/HSP70/actin superfamily)
MKVTFPRLGSLNIPLESLFEDLSIETLPPPPLTKKTLNLGVKHAPESACLPFKLVLGNFIEALEMGTDALMIIGGNGPCRFGLFGDLANEILQDLGYEFEFYILEPPIKSIVEVFANLSADFSYFKAIKALKLAWEKLIVIEGLNEYRLRNSVYLSRGLSRRLDDKYYKLISQVREKDELIKIKESYKQELLELNADRQLTGLKIGIIGDIYTVAEPFANLDVERRLNELGAEIDRAVYISKWVKNNLIYSPLGLPANRKVIKASQDYLELGVGGLGRETVGEAVLYGQKGYDGIIQLAPFGCMPEIVAKSILIEIEQDLDIPILPLTLDEQASATGMQTRLEAFVDLLKQKRHNDEKAFLRQECFNYV